MSAILTAIVFVKSVSGSDTLNGVATARLDDDEYIDFQYKAFGINENDLLEAIQVNTIMLFIGKYVFNDSQLYVSIVSLFIYFSLLFFLLINEKKRHCLYFSFRLH